MTYAIKSASGRSTDRWENEGGPAYPPDMPSRDELESELDGLGITPVRLTVFDWGGYRYSNARDAIAAAKRPPSARRESSTPVRRA